MRSHLRRRLSHWLKSLLDEPVAPGGPREGTALPPDFLPLSPLPSASVALDGPEDPVLAIVASAEFRDCDGRLGGSSASRSALLGSASQALLYSLARNLRPADVVEIGTYKAGTTEVLCRAAMDNGFGTVHTVDLFGRDVVTPILNQWPDALRRHVQFYPTDSMAFFSDAIRRGLRPALIFIDGDHDYEFARFDIEASARILRPGGLIVADNIEQAGPYFAIRDFLDQHPDWKALGHTPVFRPDQPFDRERQSLPGVTVWALQSPFTLLVTQRPTTTGERLLRKGTGFGGISVRYRTLQAAGTLHVQIVFREFGETPSEWVAGASVTLHDDVSEARVLIDAPWPDRPSGPRHVEPWLAWSGPGTLYLEGEPQLLTAGD
jgi:hypothetical protein